MDPEDYAGEVDWEEAKDEVGDWVVVVRGKGVGR